MSFLRPKNTKQMFKYQTHIHIRTHIYIHTYVHIYTHTYTGTIKVEYFLSQIFHLDVYVKHLFLNLNPWTPRFLSPSLVNHHIFKKKTSFSHPFRVVRNPSKKTRSITLYKKTHIHTNKEKNKINKGKSECSGACAERDEGEKMREEGKRTGI